MQALARTLMVLVFFTTSSCAARGLQLQSPDKRLLALEKEKEKLRRQTDPVDRTKTNIKISEILITLVTDAVKANDLEVVELRLDEYVDTIQEAHQTMVKTGRDAHRRPKGFKDLEISLRRQVRQLEDLGGTLAFDDREPVEKAKAQAIEIRDDLIRLLFGGINAPTRS
ncbi:MAG: hypothetical protein HY646_17770 [Acidobacteria bacterium]|nr:hypothetical protein [Acidobacteriota bacterium]